MSKVICSLENISSFEMRGIKNYIYLCTSRYTENCVLWRKQRELFFLASFILVCKGTWCDLNQLHLNMKIRQFKIN